MTLLLVLVLRSFDFEVEGLKPGEKNPFALYTDLDEVYGDMYGVSKLGDCSETEEWDADAGEIRS